MIPFADTLRALRKNAGMTQADVAERAGVQVLCVRLLEKRSPRQRGNVGSLQAVLRVFDRTCDPIPLDLRQHIASLPEGIRIIRCRSALPSVEIASPSPIQIKVEAAFAFRGLVVGHCRQYLKNWS